MNTPTDHTRYQELQEIIRASNSLDAVQAAWEESESLKNRNGGFPPGRPFDFNDDEQTAVELAVESGVR